ncbi:protein phosphatase 1 regulatory subunit 14D isoform X2 [Hippopotamus amphibius kiboko]|uniref:protein phosphatase 1 regulatory subunit 14D isoform X2 n=1 Tax=Hippopotamus amphibius kiboko TaxID=575201 RepID=UPI002591F632|nr:protein phosphatase 1 regulatory subunit 14D isoform X2 [Hippopotamus amphibius kiboko]
MLSSSPTSCTSPNPDKENPSKKVQWASRRSRRTSSTDSESKSQPDPSKVSRSRKPSRLTVKYDRGQLQRWLEMEQWVDAQVQELFQDQSTPSEPEIDLEALMELSTEEQHTQLEAILQNCPRPTEVRDALLVWSLLSLSCSVNSRNFGDSVGLRNKPCETTFISFSTARSALNPWILG